MKMKYSKNFKKFMENFWNIKFLLEGDFCLKCGSKNLHRYMVRIVVYDSDYNVVDYKDWVDNPYSTVKCQECGWNNL